MSDFIDWEKPLPFVIIDEENLRINQEAATMLSKIDLPAIVVGISGSYRKGKSYLMNRIAKKQKGFPVGHELQTETKGIWIWCRKHPEKPNTVLILLDTEGLDSCHENNRVQDMHIFTLTVLLSSAFIYNISEGIDANTVDRLYFVAELVKKIKINSNNEDESLINSNNEDESLNNSNNEDESLIKSNNEDDSLINCNNEDESLIYSNNEDESLVHYSMHFPLFILAIRNFYLSLKKNGREITPDEYFDDALKLKADDKSESSFNQPRRIIRSAFRRHHCFTFPLPDNTEELENLSDDNLKPNFCKQCNEFCEFIYQHAPVKKIGMNNASGNSFLTLTKDCVEKLNSGLDICLQPTISFVIEKQNAEVKNQCVKLYNEEMNKTQFPISDRDLIDFHNLANDKAMAYFRAHVFFDEDGKIFEELQDLIPIEFEKIVELNKKLSLEKCSEILDELYADKLADKIGEFYRPGGHEEYKNKIKEILKKYKADTKEETMSAQAKENFLEGHKIENDSIMELDTAMTKIQKEQENQKNIEKIKRRIKERIQIQKEKEKALRENVIKKYQEDFRKLQSQMENSEEEAIRDYELILLNRIQQRDKFLREGRKEEAAELDYQIEEMTKTIKRYKDKIIKKRVKLGLITGAFILGTSMFIASCGTAGVAAAGSLVATIGKAIISKVPKMLLK